LSYAFSGIFIGLPLILILIKTAGYRVGAVVTAIIMFALALLFRETDAYSFSLFPMGTHFLWHVFSGIGAWFILDYLYWFRSRELNFIGNAQNHHHTVL